MKKEVTFLFHAHRNDPERIKLSGFFLELGEIQIFLQGPLLGPLGSLSSIPEE